MQRRATENREAAPDWRLESEPDRGERARNPASSHHSSYHSTEGSIEGSIQASSQMSKHKDAGVTLIDADHARRLMADAFSALDVESTRWAEAALWYLHDRHVGISPELTAELAVTIGPPARDRFRGAGRVDALWTRMFERLGEELEGAPRARGGGPAALWRLVPPAFLLGRVVAPVVARACREGAHTVLFDRNPAAGGASTFNYARYAIGIEREVRRLLDDATLMSRLFWSTAAYAAYGFTRQRATVVSGAAAARDFNPYPQPDGATIVYLRSLEPEVEAYRATPAIRAVTRRRALHHRQGVRPKEGGVVGIRRTTFDDDIGDAVLSEFMNPPLLMLDRVLNEGFIVRHRPPSRWPRRDILLVGMMPSPARTETERFAKVAWLDAMLRMGLLLRAAGLRRADMRWIESCDPGSHVCAGVALDQIDLPANAQPWSLDRGALLGFLCTGQWLPGFLETLSSKGFPDRVPEPMVPHGRLASAWARWLAGAMEGALAATPPVVRDQGQGQDRASGPGTSLEDYAAVHVCVFLPDSEFQRVGSTGREFERLWSGERLHFIKALGLDEALGHSVSVCSTPMALSNGATFNLHWPFEDLSRPVRVESSASLGGQAQVKSLNRAAGQLGAGLLEIAVEAFNAR